MIGGKTLIDTVEIVLRNTDTKNTITLWIDVWDNSLSRRWLHALDHVLAQGNFLQKHFCFLGFANSRRNGEFLCAEINKSISYINDQNLGYKIDDIFVCADCFDSERRLLHHRFNRLHRYFEDLQGVSGGMSQYWHAADNQTRWHISQLNLLCHEFEAWAMSWRKKHTQPQWQRPNQIMCWNHAPRFALHTEDFDLFGVDTIARPLGGVFVGVNKAVGKHHWEVFQDEGRDSRIDELTTTTLRSQTEAAADFDIEWGQDPGQQPFMHQRLADFRAWLEHNGFDPDDPGLTIGHPQIGQVDIQRSFGTNDHNQIWEKLYQHLDVITVKTSRQCAEYDYEWNDQDYIYRMTGEKQ